MVSSYQEVAEMAQATDATNSALLEALDAASEGFALYDASDRLAYCNKRYRALIYPDGEEFIGIGQSFETIIRLAAEGGMVLDAAGRVTSWVEERLARHRNPGSPHVQRHRGDRWIHIHERRLADGCLIAIYTDITDLKCREAEFAAKSVVLEATLENMGQGISMVDADNRFVACNRTFQALMGLPPGCFEAGGRYDEFLGYAAKHGRFRTAGINAIDLAVPGSAGEVLPDVCEFVRQDGAVIAIRRTSVAGGGFVATYTDVTEHRRIVQALHESEERYALAMKGANEGLWDWNARTNEIYLSNRARELAGLEAEGATITPAAWVARIHPEDVELYRQHLVAHLRGKSPFYTAEYRVRGRDGAYRWILNRGLGVRNAIGRIDRMAGSLRNITERKRAEMELREAKEQAEAASRIKSQILTNVSHELRTPLNAVIGIAEVLEEEAQDLGRGDFAAGLQRIRGAGRHLLDLINQILDLSSLEAGTLRLRAETIEPLEVLQSAVAACRQLAEKNGNGLDLRCPERIGCVRADPQRLRQVVGHVLNNACKFTHDGQIVVTAACREDVDRRWLTIAVADTGIGMTDEQLANVFGPFAQADSSASRRYGGAGIGLAVSRRLCHLMGGDIEVASVPGQGTTVTVKLPAERGGN
jgi:two-component system, sensor histidine kinase and response regulator